MTFSELYASLHGDDANAFYVAVNQITHMSTDMHEAWKEYVSMRQ
jgi:hypothetical protein